MFVGGAIEGDGDDDGNGRRCGCSFVDCCCCRFIDFAISSIRSTLLLLMLRFLNMNLINNTSKLDSNIDLLNNIPELNSNINFINKTEKLDIDNSYHRGLIHQTLNKNNTKKL